MTTKRLTVSDIKQMIQELRVLNTELRSQGKRLTAMTASVEQTNNELARRIWGIDLEEE